MKDIGKLLRQKREEKKLQIKTVHIKTHIPIKFINALEEGNINNFPAEVYILGFLRTYAKFLGLDDEKLIENYRNYKFETTKQEVQLINNAEPAHKPKLTILISLIIFVFIAIFAIILFKPVNEISIIKNKPAPVKSQIVLSSDVKEVKEQEMMRLDVTCIKNSWFKIVADQTVVYQGILLASEQKKWEAREKFYIVVGFAPGVRIKLNDLDIDVIKTAKQDVSVLELTRENLK